MFLSKPLRRGKTLSNNEFPYRLRLRLLIGKPLTIEDPTHTFSLGGQEMVLRSRDGEMPLKQASWLIMETGGFPSEEAAYDFGQRLKLAMMHSALRCNTGVDLGHDVPTSGPYKPLVDLAREAHGLELRSDVHGLDVFPDLPNTRSLSVNARGTISIAPGPFLQRISEAVEQEPNLSPETYEAIVLLNVARAR